MGRCFVWTVWTGLLAGLVLAFSVSAEPLDVKNSTARWIQVRFEVSPEDEPGSLDRRWSAPRRAYLVAGMSPAEVQIRIPAEVIEAQLRSTGTDAVPGSFSEFVWTLDRETRHVTAARLTGRVRERLRLGPFESSAGVDIRVAMSTERSGGFLSGGGTFGVRTYRFCSPTPARRECHAVPAIRYDPIRGYVNAVGEVRASHAFAEFRAFSPLGEVEFLEWPELGTATVVSGPSDAEEVCSAGIVRGCSGDLGGES